MNENQARPAATEGCSLRSVFKYFPARRIRNVAACELVFSPLSAFNDPFEGRPHVQGMASDPEILEAFEKATPGAVNEAISKLPPGVIGPGDIDGLGQLLNRMMVGHELPAQLRMFADLMGDLARKVPELLNGHVGALCLCEINDSLTMWAHYAESHTGFVLELDAQHPFFNRRRSASDEFYHLRRVRYRPRRPSGNMMDFDAIEMFCLKGEDWGYEKEWRMLAPLDAANTVRHEGGRDIHVFKFPVDAIRSITIGARASETLKEEVRVFAAGAAHPISVYQAHASETHFELDMRRVL